MRSRLAFSVLTLVTLGGCTSVRDTGQSASRVDGAKISEVLKGFVDNGALVGVSALVTQDGKEAYFGAFGYADREARRPMTRDTLVQIYSMTKPITGTALMQLWEQGKFHLDDPCPITFGTGRRKGLRRSGRFGNTAPRPPNRPMTIRDLTRHTSGLTYGESSDNATIKALAVAADPLAITNTLDEFARRRHSAAGIPARRKVALQLRR